MLSVFLILLMRTASSRPWNNGQSECEGVYAEKAT